MPKIFQWTKPWSFIAYGHSQTKEIPSHFERIHYVFLCCDLLTQHLLPTLSSFLLTNKTSVFLFMVCKFIHNKLTFSAYTKW
jgi:hypothetical protein